MRYGIVKRLRRISATLAATALFATAGQAQPVQQVYEGKTVTILIGHPPGGSYDLYAQLAAEFLGEHLPGHPNVIVEHMPGGDGRKAGTYFVNQVAPDGLTVAILPDTLGHLQLLTPDQAGWDAARFRYIGRFAPANAAFALRTDAPAQSVEDMKTAETVVSCIGRSARSAQQSAALRNVGGLNLRIICGYSGSSAAELATLRGETDLYSQNWASFKSDMTPIEDGSVKIVLQAGLERDPDLPDVPLLQEVTDDPEAQEILTFVSSGAPIGRSMMAHPDTPEYLIDALRSAFADMIADPDFQTAAQARSAIINTADGPALEAVMQQIMSASPELLAAAKIAMDASDAEELQK